MSDLKAFIDADVMRAGLSIVFVRELHDGAREISNGSTGWVIYPGGATVDNVEPLRLNDEQGRALLAGLLRHYNGADDARMLRKDYDAERKRVDLLIDRLANPVIIQGGEVVQR